MAGALREVIDSLSEHDAHALLDRIAELDATGALDDREKALEVYHAAFGEDAVPQGTERMLAPVTEQAGVRLWQKVVLAACVPLVLVCLGAFFYLEVGQGDAESGEKPEHAPVTVAALEARNAPEPPLVEEEPEPPAGPVEESELSSLPAKSDAGATPARPLRAPESRPAPRAEGEFVAMIMPWARLTLLEDLETGEPVERGLTTPARMSLPVGRYRMTFDNPHASAPLVVEVTLAAGEERIVRRTMPGFEVGDLTRDLLARQGLTRGDNP